MKCSPEVGWGQVTRSLECQPENSSLYSGVGRCGDILIKESHVYNGGGLESLLFLSLRLYF